MLSSVDMKTKQNIKFFMSFFKKKKIDKDDFEMFANYYEMKRYFTKFVDAARICSKTCQIVYSNNLISSTLGSWNVVEMIECWGMYHKITMIIFHNLFCINCVAPCHICFSIGDFLFAFLLFVEVQCIHLAVFPHLVFMNLLVIQCLCDKKKCCTNMIKKHLQSRTVRRKFMTVYRWPWYYLWCNGSIRIGNISKQKQQQQIRSTRKMITPMSSAFGIECHFKCEQFSNCDIRIPHFQRNREKNPNADNKTSIKL